MLIPPATATGHAPARTHALKGPTIQAALFISFGVSLGFWLIAGYQLTGRMREVETAATTINSRYVKAQDLLSRVETEVLLGSTLLRDALLASGLGTEAVDRKRLESTYAAAHDAIQAYVPLIDSPAEREGISTLSREVDRFRLAMLAVFDTRAGDQPAVSRALLQQRVMPRREVVLRISEQVQSLNRSTFVAQTQATADVYRVAQRHALQQLGIALAANLAIAILAGAYAGRLERRLHRQRARDLAMTNDLHRLSGQIVNAQEDERRMIARELHDEVGQTLAAIRVELAYVERHDTDPLTTARHLEDLRHITERALHSIRDLSHLLHPAILDDLGLIAALQSLATSVGERHKLTITLHHERMNDRLAPALETAVYRIVQEAFTNVVKHAQATTCRVTVRRKDDELRLVVVDNGVGFALTPRDGDAGHRGIGLIGMRERAALLGGTLHVASSPGRGTTLTIEFPIRKDDVNAPHANLPR